jgi:signal transduction histidine kinase
MNFPGATKVLLVEDSTGDARLVMGLLKHVGSHTFSVTHVQTLADALRNLDKNATDLVILDLGLPDSTGLDTFQRLQAQRAGVPVVVLTGTDDDTVGTRAIHEGAQDYIPKNQLQGHLLVRSIRYALERHHNVLALRESSEQLRQSQKMEAIGRLAGGVAHDFNNLLGVILGSAELLAESTDLGNVRMRTAEILKAGRQAASLTRQLLAFSRKQILQPSVIDLNAKLSEAVGMLERLVGENIKICTSLAKNLGRVRTDPTQIEQITLNLVVNAREAMPQGGKIAIETQNIDLDEAYTSSHASMLPGRYVMIAVSDSGVGMDAETQAHIFEPFFTTKNGIGLGLSTVYGAVKQSGGNIWVYSEPGKGTTFKIYFPRVDAPADKTEPRPCSSLTPTGTETILLVEDSDSLREVTKEFLRMAGYHVMEACDGKQALDVARTYKEPIHLLLTDVVMPGIGGRDLSKQLHHLHPETQILFMSGYTAGAIDNHEVLDEGVRLLSKPFTRAVLVQTVRQSLNS